MDDLDFKILTYLSRQGRMTWSELASQLGLSPPAAADRVHRLEANGIIQGYAAQIAPDRLGYNLTAFIAVTLERPEHRSSFLECVQAIANIQECHHITGDDDYLMKVRCRNTAELEHLISDVLKQLPGIVRTRTLIALSSPKESIVVPLE